MDRLHARYPFLEAAREAVEDADADLAALVESEDPAVERAVGRVEACLSSGTVGEPHRDPRAELLSYPLARVLVSLLDRPALVRRYADAEARTAYDRFRRELADDGLRSTRGERLTLRRLLAEFDLAGRVRPDGEGLEAAARYRVPVGAYLALTAGLEDGWRLATRPLADGDVPVTREELLVLLREAVRERVAEGLPFEVPGRVADALAPAVEHLEALLGERAPPGPVDAVVPELFPPCMAALLERVRAGESLPSPARFGLVAFLTSAGLAPEEVAALFPDDAGGTAAYQARRLGGEAGAGYAPPSCATMQAYGACLPPGERDARWEELGDPLSCYAAALEDAGEVDDWRDDGTPLAERL